MSIDLLKEIAQTGLRIFNQEDITKLTVINSYSATYANRLLKVLQKKGEVVSLGKGLYTLPIELLAGGPIHPFEIAIKLAKEGAISHRSAMVHHHLTDQVISSIYITVPRGGQATGSHTRRYNLQGSTYYLHRVDFKHYWGIKKSFIGEAGIWITDLERTLIDGLSQPELCGGMREVIFAFERGIEKSKPELLYEYANRRSRVACKRLGWILDHLKVYEDLQEELRAIPMGDYQRFDPSGKRNGTYNKKWMLVENI